MVSREMIEIILKAEDQASKVVKENENAVKKFGDAAKQANDAAGKSSQQMQQKMQMTNKQINDTTRNIRQIGRNGSESFNSLSKSQQDAAIKFNMLDKETQTLLQHMNTLGRNGLSGIGGAINDAKSKFAALDGVTNSWKGSLDYSRSKLQLLGTNTDSLKGKLQTVGNAVTTYIGTKWDNLKTKVSSFGSFIKEKLTGALSHVRSALDSLGSAFSGLGGIISTAIGGLGMASITDMTVGLAMNRERMTALTSATMGSADAGKQFVGVMDNLTNTSLVSLDDLGQAMSTIKMSTGMTNTQLESFTTTVNDVGQRAILMGRSGDEAMALMQAAGRGLNGEFDMLKTNFGITKDKLESLGWSGAADDVEGYQSALDKALEEGGSMNGMMDTSVGHLETLKKNFRIAGRHVGEMFTPYIDQAVVKLNELNDTCPGLFEGLVEIAGGVSMFATVAPTIDPMLRAFDNLASKSKGVLRFLGLMKAEEGALTLATVKETAAQKISAATKYLSGIATATYGAIVGVLTGEIGLATAAQTVWNAVMAANPIGLIIIAVAALAVAVYELGKMWGWWSDVGTMLDAIKAGLTRLWSAFVNNPNVKGIIKGIGDAWVQLQEASKPIIEWLSGIWDTIFPQAATEKWDAVRIIIEAIGMAFTFMTMPIRGLITILQILYPYMLQLYQTVLVPLGGFLQSIFVPVWNAIVSIISLVIPYVQNMVSAFSSFASGQMTLPDLIYAIWNNLWTIYITILGSIGRAVTNWAVSIVQKGVNAARNFTSGIVRWISTLPGKFLAYFLVVGSIILTQAIHWVQTGVSKASAFVSGVISYISNLPGRFAAYLFSIVEGIVSAGASWISTGVSKASEMVNGIINNVSQLPGKVYTEFMNIGSRMLQAGSELVNKAVDIGKNIVNGLLNAMGIHSPGIIQESVVGEFVDMLGNVKNKVKSAYDTAKMIGSAIVDGFGNPKLETDVSNILPNDDAIKTQVGVKAQLSHPMNTPSSGEGMDSSMITASNQNVISSFDNLATQTGTALQEMVNKDKMAYNTIRTNDSAQLSAISSNLQNSMGKMTSNVKTSMNTMVNKNKTALRTIKTTTDSNMNSVVTKTKTSLANVKNTTVAQLNNVVTKTKTGMSTVKKTTETNLDNIVSKTKDANSQMIDSWEVMKDGIVSAADRIKTDSTSHFNRLEDTIGSFYRKLQNPGGFGAGPGSGSVSTARPLKRAGSSGISKITNAMRKAQLPQYMTLSQLKKNPFVSMSNIGDYVTKGKNNMYSVSDLIRSGNIRIPIGLEDPKNKGAGGWTDGVGNHVQKIKDISNEWSMKGPVIIGKYPTSHGFKVKEFLNGTPRIDFATFKGMAEDVFSQCHYEFYYDSNKYGNWMTAFQHGGMNCSDSSDALIAMAHACGLDAYKVHGHWNQYGHFWANVAGHKMDTTGWMNRRDWTPAASHAGPAPKSLGFADLIDAIKGIFDDDPTPAVGNLGENPGEVSTIEGEIKVKHEFIDLPENIDAAEVARLINEIPDDQNWIKKLVKNVVFQKFDLREKARIEGKNKRARGI